MLYHNIESHVKDYNVYLLSKTVCHKYYSNIQSFLVSIHYWNNLLIDFVTGLQILANEKNYSYDIILIYVDYLTKMVY